MVESRKEKESSNHQKETKKIGLGPIGVLKGTPTRELDPKLYEADPD